jgi:membrane protein
MSRAPSSEHTHDLALIAATTILILTAQRYFQTIRPRSVPQTVAQGSDSLREGGDRRRARSPFSLKWATWKDILWRTYQRSNDDRLLATAGGVVFFGLLAVFPAITALVSSYGLFADPSTILMLPEGSFQIIQDQVARVLEKGNAALGSTFLFGLALAIWSANAGVKAVIDALNVAYEEREKRGFIGLNLLSLAFTIGGIAAVLVMVSAVVAFPLVLGHLGLEPGPLAVAVPGPADGAGARRNGNGLLSEHWPPPCSGSPALRRYPGIFRTSVITTRPTARLVQPSA